METDQEALEIHQQLPDFLEFGWTKTLDVSQLKSLSGKSLTTTSFYFLFSIMKNKVKH